MQLNSIQSNDINTNNVDLTKKENTINRLERLVTNAFSRESAKSKLVSTPLNERTESILKTSDKVYKNAFKISVVALFALSVIMLIIPGGAPVGIAIMLGIVLLYPNVIVSWVIASIAESLTKAYLTNRLKDPKEIQASNDRVEELNSLKNYFINDIYKDEQKNKATVITWLDKLFLESEFKNLMNKIETTKDLNTKEFSDNLKKLKDLIEQRKKEQYKDVIITNEASINK